MEAKLLRESNPNPRTRSNRLDLGLGFDSLSNFASILVLDIRTIRLSTLTIVTNMTFKWCVGNFLTCIKVNCMQAMECTTIVSLLS